MPNKGLEMDIKRTGSQPSTKGPIEYFTGSVRIDPLFQANDPARNQQHLKHEGRKTVSKLREIFSSFSS
jgi:hypothetical protein